jgi:hypothetical protein
VKSNLLRTSHKVLARWRYGIEMVDDRISIEAMGNRIALPMVHHMLLHPSLRVAASQNGLMLLHASAVVKNGRSLIFTGSGGTGKTTISSLLLADPSNSWGYHADDYVFLGAGGKTYSYLTRSHLYADLFRWVPEVSKELSRSEIVKVTFFSTLRKLSGEKIKWPVRISSDRLWPNNNYVPSARAAGVILLSRGSVKHPEITKIDENALPLDEILDMNFSESRYFLKLMNRVGGNAPGWDAAWVNRERELLESWSRSTPFYKLELPSEVVPDKVFRDQLVELLTTLLEE